MILPVGGDQGHRTGFGGHGSLFEGVPPAICRPGTVCSSLPRTVGGFRPTTYLCQDDRGGTPEMQRRPCLKHRQKSHFAGQHRYDEAPAYSGSFYIEDSPIVTRRDVGGNGARALDVS
jgi:hypothetical protein